MGNSSSFEISLKQIASKEEARILVTGMNWAGKTTILYKLNIGEVIVTCPTIGLILESVRFRNLTFAIWDLGCSLGFKTLWKYFHTNIKGIIFVIDSNDRERMDNLKWLLQEMLFEEMLSQLPILFFANKQDLPNAISLNEITEKLELFLIRGRIWRIQGCSAIRGDGLYEGIEWISHVLNFGS
ncbi:unnamed protein product [Blepharisma stoltei]|uniref:Uncharacterized protein n=1 Tax=Blepharisma stoltei TaxID=1481888 RepID=A0AAU9IGI5_9CILI|nr:unnamed protein product [Blepharisma stoltei]